MVICLCAHLFYSSLLCLAPVLTLKDLVGPFCSAGLISEARKVPRKGKAVDGATDAVVISGESLHVGCLPAPLGT